MKTFVLLGCTAALIVFSDRVWAKTPDELQAIARASTVEIKLRKDNSVGSGVIIHRQGDLYTLVTNRHVVCGGRRCNQLPAGESYSIGLADSSAGGTERRYNVSGAAIKLLGNDLDLAIVQFRSRRQYTVATAIDSQSLKVDDPVYTAGFPFAIPGFSFNVGRAVAVVNKRLTADKGGYSIIYDATTLPGMSGGGVFNREGQLVAIHGVGDRVTAGTNLDDDEGLNSKIGYNRGIPIRWLVQSLRPFKIDLNISEGSIAQTEATSADEHFIVGFNKHLDPGLDLLAGKQQALQSFNAAIQLNPRYAIAYFMRGYVHSQLQEFQKSVDDYSRVIELDSRLVNAYNNRGTIRARELNDPRGALADFNYTITTSPQNAIAYGNRGLIKEQMNDLRGALADYNRAIELNPKASYVYSSRGSLKSRMNDLPGALADHDRAVALNPSNAYIFYNRANLKSGPLKDYPGALADFDRAIALKPRYGFAYANRGTVKKKMDNLTGAMADYDRALEIDPTDTVALANRGDVKSRLNDRVGALADFDRAIALQPNNGGTYYGRSNVKKLMNDLPGAIQDMRRAAQLFRAQGQTEYLQIAIEQLGRLGATEKP
jgi:tetratricopeptide (TPR) repeat protein